MKLFLKKNQEINVNLLFNTMDSKKQALTREGVNTVLLAQMYLRVLVSLSVKLNNCSRRFLSIMILWNSVWPCYLYNENNKCL